MTLPAPAFEWVCHAASTGLPHGDPGLQSYLGFTPESSTLVEGFEEVSLALSASVY